MVICLVRDNHGLFGFWWIELLKSSVVLVDSNLQWMQLLECVKAGDCWWDQLHTHRHWLYYNNTVYLLTHDIALSFSQLHCVLISTDIALSFSQLHHVTIIDYFLLGQHSKCDSSLQ